MNAPPVAERGCARRWIAAGRGPAESRTDDRPDVSYAISFPSATIVKIIAVQILLRLSFAARTDRVR